MATAIRGLIRTGTLLALSTLARSDAQTLTTLYSFVGEGGDGAGPYAGVVIGASGEIYGATGYGGIYNSGTIFELAPPAVFGGPWTETVLHSFGGGSDGAYPYGGVVIGPGGVLYGATRYGGASGLGAVFELIPPAVSGGVWTETLIYNFSGSDGAYPFASPTLATNGTLYGTTELGGAFDYGTVFELVPPSGSGAWTESVLYSFTGGNDGGCPYDSLTIGANGKLYGTTDTGGASQKGTAFSVTPPATGDTWTEKAIFSFPGGNSGGFPYGSIAIGANGVIYGTTAGSVNAGNGTAFELTPPSGSGAWKQTVLHSFTGNADGGAPHAVLTPGANGTYLGTTFGGGTGKRFDGHGTIFQLTPPSGTGKWTETVLYDFNSSDGGEPNAPLLANGTGGFYSTTFGGGVFGQGTVFLFMP